MNKLLQRQIAEYLGSIEAIPAEIEHLLKVINESYDQFEKGHKMPEHSIEKSAEAENERMQRAAHLETSQRIAHIGSWEMDLTDIDGTSNSDVYWSDETYRIFGFEPGSVKVTRDLCSSIVPADDWEAIQIAVKKALDEGEVYDVEHRVVVPDGTEKIVHERGDIIKNETTGEPLKMIGTVRDITDKKRADSQLRKANYELKTLFENMQECIFTVDTTVFKLIQISSSCADIYGYTADEFLNNDNLWIDIVVEEDKALIWSQHQLLEKGESVTNTYRIRDKKGHIRWLETKIKPTLDKARKLVRLDGVTADITKRVDTEQALQMQQ